MSRAAGGWGALERAIVDCRRCPRLVAHREAVAQTKRRQFRDEPYWGRPVTGFGDRQARLWLVGLAPAAHGGNRTGRVFTGDRSGDFLFAALHATGFANQATSTHRRDGLALRGAFVSAVCRCCPPANKLLPEEIRNCRPYLLAELAALAELRVVVALGKIAMDGFLGAWAASGRALPSPRPKFAHGAEHALDARVTLLCTYHPSQQNTFTGRLTQSMLRQVFRRAAELIG
jgi:uracil-DNA glycosylase family 4